MLSVTSSACKTSECFLFMCCFKFVVLLHVFNSFGQYLHFAVALSFFIIKYFRQELLGVFPVEDIFKVNDNYLHFTLQNFKELIKDSKDHNLLYICT